MKYVTVSVVREIVQERTFKVWFEGEHPSNEELRKKAVEMAARASWPTPAVEAACLVGTEIINGPDIPEGKPPKDCPNCAERSINSTASQIEGYTIYGCSLPECKFRPSSESIIKPASEEKKI